MAAIKYMGRYPDFTNVVVPKSYVDTQNAAVGVDAAYIDQQCANAAGSGSPLVNQAYVSQQVAQYLTQSQVSAYNSVNYVARTALFPNQGGTFGIDLLDGTAAAAAADNGDGTVASTVTDNLDRTATPATSGTTGIIPAVAKSDANGNAQANQLPTLVRDRVAQCYDLTSAGAMNIIGSGNLSVTSAVPTRDLASITVPDPGYAWIPMPFALVLSASSGTPGPSRFLGNSGFGFLTVSPAGSPTTYYGAGVCSPDPRGAYYQVLPYASPVGQMTPATRPAVYGGATLVLRGELFGNSGTNGYTYNGNGLVFYVLVMPAA